MQLANTVYTHSVRQEASRQRGAGKERGRIEGGRDRGREGGGGGSKVMVGERTRGGRERRKEGGREQGDGRRGNKGRDGGKEGGRE